ncbi:BTAD domain-containing putative transcriptional regulator [Streptomyces johnsoniae]|uniref:BTAD domain-containing putative transcriptional regulator n=1 Tax=Streptomyces johnsoniae TaxID=3075532 RepID=UPI00374E1C01
MRHPARRTARKRGGAAGRAARRRTRTPGMHGSLVGELQELAGDFPLREDIHAHLMVTLYRTGRQTDALGAFERMRSTLANELGIEPGRSLPQLHSRIRAGDAAPGPAGRDGGVPR